MRHLFLCREFPRAAYLPGGIGTYVRHISGLLAEAGEIVHVIAHRWDGAPEVRQETVGGRLIVHRVALDESIPGIRAAASEASDHQRVALGMLASTFPSQAFSWQAALLAERLIDSEGIDVIEAQEWEAPLYYFQLRRALNLSGATRRPPCIVHLHSPSEQIFAANDWDTTVVDYLPAAAAEEYSIKAADAVLSPSRFLAEQAVRRYQLDRSHVTVIPYPLGDVPHLDRTADTWAGGSICHIGRLELRKGVLELADAVGALASEHPNLQIEFVGGDTQLNAASGATVGEAVRARVAHDVRRRLRFHGNCDRRRILAVLSNATAAVVASRWENLPYSCIESMASGLPVVTSPNGGMSELVADGISGWIASDSTPAGLAEALRRALETPAGERARMGAAAERTVRETCANETVVRRHLELNARVVAGISSKLAADVSASASGVPDATPLPSGGIGLIVFSPAKGTHFDACVASILAQTERPAYVCVVPDESGSTVSGVPDGWRLMAHEGRSLDQSLIAAAQLMVSSEPSPAGFAFVDARLHLKPHFVAACRTLFAEHADLGLVSGWIHETEPRDRVHIPRTPSAPHIWHEDEIGPLIAVRTTALKTALAATSLAAPVRRVLVLDGIMRSGWTGLIYPAVLGSMALGERDSASRPAAARYSSIAQAIQRHHTPLLQWLLSCPSQDRRAFVRQGLRNPARSARWLAGRTLVRWRTRLQGSL